MKPHEGERHEPREISENLSEMNDLGLMYWLEDVICYTEVVDVYALVRVMTEFIHRGHAQDFQSALEYIYQESNNAKFYTKLQIYFSDDVVCQNVEQTLQGFLADAKATPPGPREKKEKSKPLSRAPRNVPERIEVTPEDLERLAHQSVPEKAEIQRLMRELSAAVGDNERAIARQNLDLFLDRLPVPTLKEDPHHKEK